MNSLNDNKLEMFTGFYFKKTDPKSYYSDDPIELLHLPKRIEKALRSKNINTVSKLYRCKRKRLYKVKYLGKKSVSYLMKFKHQIRLKQVSVNVQTNKNIPKSTWIPSSDDIPEFFLSRADKLEVLNLPVRIENSLKNGGVDRIGIFFDCSLEELASLRNLGPKSIYFLRQIRKKIKLYDEDTNVDRTKKTIDIDSSLIRNRYLIKKRVRSEKFRLIAEELLKQEVLKDRETVKKKEIVNPKIPNEALIPRLIERCKDPRMIEIVKRRYGFIDGQRETLEEIGKSFGVSRERVRQIQVYAIRKLRHPSVVERGVIVGLIERMLSENSGVISDEEADKLIPKIFKNIPYDGSSLLDLLEDLGWVDSNDIGDVRLYSDKVKKLNYLQLLMSEIKDILKKSSKLLTAKEIARKLSVPHFNDWDRFILLVKKCCELDPRIEEKASRRFTVFLRGTTKKNIWVSFMVQVLNDEGAPLHFTEVADRVSDLLASDIQHLDHRRAHSILIESPLFAHTGIRGMYGLTRWGLSKKSTMELVKEYIKKAGFPVHWEQIYNYVSKYKESKKMSIRSILSTSGYFENKGKGFYWIKNR